MIKETMANKNISHNIKLLKWYNFFSNFRPFSAVAALYLAQVAGSYTAGLSVFAISSVASALFEVPTGIISDRIGRRRTVIFASFSSIISMSLYAASHSFALLAVGGIFAGLTSALLSGNNDALLYDTLKQQGKSDEFSDKFGKVNSLLEVGLAVSALLASALVLISLRAAVIASVLPQIICLFIAFRFTEPKVRDDGEPSTNTYQHLKEAFLGFTRNAKLRKLSLANMLSYALGDALYDLKPAFTATLWPNWALGIARFLDNALGYAGYHFAGPLTKRFGAIKTLFGQQIIERLLTLTAAGLPTIVSPALLTVNSFFFGVGETAGSTLLHREFSDKQRATMDSLNSLGGSLLYALATVGTGISADKFGPAKTILFIAVLSFSIAIIYGNLFKHHKE